MTKELINTILEKEWAMFSTVKNYGSQASCQQDRTTFEIMRRSQILLWNKALLESYLNDLTEAETMGRNLMTAKYAWMMSSTYPEEFKTIEDSLPALSVNVLVEIEEILKIHIQWQEEFAAEYPKLGNKGRCIHTYEDTSIATSLETYLRGELKTYSEQTISLLLKLSIQSQNAGMNLAKENVLNQVKSFGYVDLEAAEKR